VSSKNSLGEKKVGKQRGNVGTGGGTVRGREAGKKNRVVVKAKGLRKKSKLLETKPPRKKLTIFANTQKKLNIAVKKIYRQRTQNLITLTKAGLGGRRWVQGQVVGSKQ